MDRQQLPMLPLIPRPPKLSNPLPASELPRHTVWCRKNSASQMRSLFRDRCNFVPPVLWCGTAALAGALAGKMGHLRFVPQCDALLAIVGSDRNLAAKQVERLAPSMVGVVRSSEEIEGAISKVSQR